jgi:hypothetical protein
MVQFILGPTERVVRQRRAPEKVECPVCHIRVDENYLDTHVIRHKGREARPFKCSQCPKSYLTFAHLKDHRLKRHAFTIPLAESDFYCEICSTIIFTRARYIRHLKYHVRKSGLQLSSCEPIFVYICDFDGCQICFRDSGRFMCHLESHSSNRTVFTCFICQKGFAMENNYQNHVQYAHQAQENVQDCPYCHLVIENKSEDWDWHYRSHQLRLDENDIAGKHLCEACGKHSFYIPTTLCISSSTFTCIFWHHKVISEYLCYYQEKLLKSRKISPIM